MKLVNYANKHGAPEGRPYYSLNGATPVTADEWSATRSPWNHEHGVTNVWDRPSLRGEGTAQRKHETVGPTYPHADSFKRITPEPETA